MNTVTISSKYQVVIPSSIRKSLGMQPGQKVQVLQYQDRIEMIPLKAVKSMRGFLKGLDDSVVREKDRVCRS
jgi:AbrB family looped-hinge helix DNA binding protein